MQFNAKQIGDGNVDNTEFQNLNGTTSNIQSQFNALVSALGLVSDGAGGWEAADMGGEVSIGDTKWSFATDAHDGWLPCDGAILEQDTYPGLFAAIGQVYGAAAEQIFRLSGPGNALGSALMGLATNGSGTWIWCYGNVSRDVYLLSTDDGLTWSEQTWPVASIWDIAYGNGLWIAGQSANSNTIYTSTTGLTGSWTAQTGAAYTSMTPAITAWNGTRWIRLFHSAGTYYYATSTNATSWSSGSSIVTDYGSLRNVLVWTSGLLVIQTQSGGLYSANNSASPTLTTRRAPPGYGVTTLSTEGHGLAASSTVIVACCGSDVATSTNGTSWTTRTVTGLNNYYKSVVVWDSGNSLFRLYGVYSDGLPYEWTSSDGATWTKASTPLPNDVIQARINSSGVVLANSGGDIYTIHQPAYDDDTEFVLPTVANSSDGETRFIYAGEATS